METNKNIVDFLKPREREAISDSYFEGLVSKTIISIQPKEVKKVVPIYKRPVFWMSGAAAIFVLVFTIKSFNSSSSNAVSYDFNSVSHSELLAYIDENIEDFDQDLLLEYVPEKSIILEEFPVGTGRDLSLREIPLQDEPLRRDNVQSKSTKDLFNEIDKQDILEYLDEEELNIEDLQESVDL